MGDLCSLLALGDPKKRLNCEAGYCSVVPSSHNNCLLHVLYNSAAKQLALAHTVWWTYVYHVPRAALKLEAYLNRLKKVIDANLHSFLQVNCYTRQDRCDYVAPLWGNHTHDRHTCLGGGGIMRRAGDKLREQRREECNGQEGKTVWRDKLK